MRIMPCIVLAVAAGLPIITAGCAPIDAPRAASSAPRLPTLRQDVQNGVAAGRYPGAVFAVARGSEILTIDAVGVSDTGTRAPMRTDAIFRLMSMTKPFTAVAAMKLVEQGKLSLDAPVSDVLPYFRAFGRPGEPTLTLRRLLTHSAGLRADVIPDLTRPLDERVRAVATGPVAGPVGSRWAYSGIEGPDVVARMIEVASGETFDRFLERTVLRPLGLKDTVWRLSSEQRRRLVSLYSAKDGKLTSESSSFPDTVSGGYGLYSTASDYLKFARMIAAGGTLNGVRILGGDAAHELGKAQLAMGFPGLPPGYEHGLLMRKIGDAKKAPVNVLPTGSYGWSGAYGTHFWIEPSTGLVAVWMINLTNAGGAASPDAFAFERMVQRACDADTGCRAK